MKYGQGKLYGLQFGILFWLKWQLKEIGVFVRRKYREFRWRIFKKI